MKSVKVKFKNSKHDYITSVNPKSSDKELKEYFVGNSFIVSSYPKEVFKTCLDIEIINH